MRRLVHLCYVLETQELFAGRLAHFVSKLVEELQGCDSAVLILLVVRELNQRSQNVVSAVFLAHDLCQLKQHLTRSILYLLRLV